MPKISTFEQDSSLSDLDKVFGTSSEGANKNYTLLSLTNFFAAKIAIINNEMPVSTYDADGIEEQLVGLTATQTLTNKTLDFSTGGTNNITLDSSDVDYDNSTSALTATNVKDALDELEDEIDVFASDIAGAEADILMKQDAPLAGEDIVTNLNYSSLDEDIYIIDDSSGGAITITIDDASNANNDLFQSKTFYVLAVNAGISIATSGSQSITSSLSSGVDAAGEYKIVKVDTKSWYLGR